MDEFAEALFICSIGQQPMEGRRRHPAGSAKHCLNRGVSLVLVKAHVFSAQDAQISSLRGEFLPAGIADRNEGELKERVAADATK